jgi:hypothetical protein
MSGWWFIFVIVVLAAVGILVLRSRRGRTGERIVEYEDTGQPPRDYSQEREDNRVRRMSEEDRVWEAASLQRDQEAREQEQSPPGRN